MPTSKIGTNAIENGAITAADLGNGAINLASATVTGVTPVANGGTGLAAPGANGNVLTSNGTTWTSAAAAGGSPMDLLASTTTSTSVASVDFSGFNGSTYIAYMIQFQGVRPAGDNGQLRMRLRNSGGTITATDYHNGLNTTRSDSGFTFASSSSNDFFTITSANVRSSTAGGCQGIVWVSQSANATPSYNSIASWWAPPDNVAFQSISGGAMNATQTGVVITGFNFYYNNGNITANSKITVYGLKAA